MSDDICTTFYVDEEKVNNVKRELKSDDIFFQLAETFKVLGDMTRIKILYALSVEELCVCDLTTLLNATQSAVSHQLRVLRNMRLVKYRRQGKILYYSLDDDHIRSLFTEGLKHVQE